MKNKNAGHTPGPWRVLPYPEQSLGHKKGKAFLIRSDDGTPAFEVPQSRTFACRNGAVGHYWDPKSKAKDAANARLIAAAPELLAALEMVAAEVQSGYLSEDQERQIATALKKAKGEK